MSSCLSRSARRRPALSDGPEDGPGWRSVTAVQLDRETDQVVWTGPDGGEVKAFDDPDACCEQDAVDLRSVDFRSLVASGNLQAHQRGWLRPRSLRPSHRLGSPV